MSLEKLPALMIVAALAAACGHPNDASVARASSATPPSASPTASAPTPPADVSSEPATDPAELATLVRCDDVGDGISVWSAGPKGSLIGYCGLGMPWHSLFFVPTDGPARPFPELVENLPHPQRLKSQADYAFIRAVSGDALDALTMSIYYPAARVGDEVTYRRSGAQWTALPDPASPAYRAVISSDRLITDAFAVKGRPAYEALDPGGAPMFGYVDGKPGWIPKPAAGSGGCPLRVRAHFAWVGFDDGQAFGAGVECDPAYDKENWYRGHGRGRMVVEHFSQTVKTGIVEPLPGLEEMTINGSVGFFGTAEDLFIALLVRAADGDPSSAPAHLYVASRRNGAWIRVAMDDMVVRSYDIDTLALPDGFVLATGHDIMRFSHGKLAWKTALGKAPAEPVPTHVNVQYFAMEPGGARFARVVDNVAYEVDASGSAKRIALPDAQSHATSVSYSNAGELLLVVASDGPKGQSHALLGRRRSRGQGLALSWDTAAPTISPLFFIEPLKHDCAKPVVVLYKISKVAPADYDFPATREALKGQTRFSGAKLLEIDAVGERHLVASLQGAGAVPLALALRDRIQSKVKGSSPQAFCADKVPRELPIKREIKLDYATGKIVP